MVDQNFLEAAIERQAQMVTWAKEAVAQAGTQNETQEDEKKKIQLRIRFLEVGREGIENIEVNSEDEKEQKALISHEGLFLLNIEKQRLKAVQDAVDKTYESIEKTKTEIEVDEMILTALQEKLERMTSGH